MEADRQDWFNQADVARKELVRAAEKQFERSWRCHPDPQDLIGLAGCSAMWQRRRFPTDDFKDFNDFGHVRLGVGTIKQGMQIDCPPLLRRRCTSNRPQATASESSARAALYPRYAAGGIADEEESAVTGGPYG